MKRPNYLGARRSAICTTVLIFALILFSNNAQATNGYFSHGFGLKYKAMGGAGIALSLSPLAAASNPAGMAFLGPRYDVSLSIFNPNRQYTVTGAPSMFPGTFGLTPGTIESGSKVFVIPALGANFQVNDNVSVGVSIFGNGGMNTDYSTSTFFGSSPTGVDLAQLFVAPTVAIKLAERHGFGLTPILAYQRFETTGLEAFGMFSSDAAKLTNNGHSNSVGFGARVGYLGQLMDFLSVGAAYQTKIKMGEFKDYAGLFAQQGDFDIPANWTVGAALDFMVFAFAFDVQKILYSDVAAIANPFLPNLQQAPLGSDNAAGFGWEDMTIIKLGIQAQAGEGWTWRAGYSFGDQPIPASEVLFNIIAPGVVEQHLTFGFSKTVGGGKELNFVIMRALSQSVSGPNPLEAPGQQTIELKMDQWEFGVGFSF